MISTGLTEMAEAQTVLALRDRTMAAFHALGFAHAYFLAPVTVDARFGRVMANVGFPESWAADYATHLRQVDPMPELGLRLFRAFRWSEVATLTTLTDEQARFMAGLMAMEGGDGVAVPTFGPGGRAGFVAVGGAETAEARNAPDVALLRAAGQMSYLRYCELITPHQEGGKPLSQRELDVLYWMAQGKSNSVIAELLDLSAGTVDAYVRRIFAKLGVNDRTSAVSSAVARGDIYLGYYRETSEEA